jgi:hypothetical protein
MNNMDKERFLMSVDTATVKPLEGSPYAKKYDFIPFSIDPPKPIKFVFEGDVVEFIDDDSIIATYQTNLLKEKMAACDVSHLSDEEIERYIALINGVKGYWELEQDE